VAFVGRLITSLIATSILGAANVASADPTTNLDVEPPRGTYVWVPEVVAPARDPVLASEPHILFLNRCAGGITLTAGWPDDNVANRSGILNGTTNFPEFGYGEDAWQAVMTETREIFSPFNVVVTDVDPSPMPHDEALVCGSGAAAGFSGAGGVAPFTCDVIPSPITFTFPDSLGGNPRTIAEVIAQEAAHAWGLEHEFKCEDPMSYLSGCGEKTYQQGDYPCGEYSAQSCQCGGATQNSYAYIEGLFGPAVDDLAAPTAVVTAPSDGDTFAVGDEFSISVQVSDDVGVTHLGLYLDGVLATEALSEPYGPWPVFDLPQGEHEIYVEATDAAGNLTASEVVTVAVTADGEPPPGGGSGGGGGNGDGGDGGDDGGDDGGGGDGDAGEGSGGIDFGGALPDGFGGDPEVAGCSCKASDPDGPRGATGALASVLLLGLGWASRRRRSAS